MSNHRMLEAVAGELRRQGLPSADIGRLFQELEDHVSDVLAEQGGSMDGQTLADEQIESRLGRPEVLVAAALANRRQASVFGRHPIVSFVVAPIPLAILSWVAFLLLCWPAIELVSWMRGQGDVLALRDWPMWLVYAMKAMEIGLRFVPPACAAGLLCWCAKRAAVSWKWTAAGCSLVALAAYALVVQVTLGRPEEPGSGSLQLGLGFPVHQWINLIQLLVPLATCATFLWRARGRATVPA